MYITYLATDTYRQYISIPPVIRERILNESTTAREMRAQWIGRRAPSRESRRADLFSPTIPSASLHCHHLPLFLQKTFSRPVSIHHKVRQYSTRWVYLNALVQKRHKIDVHASAYCAQGEGIASVQWVQKASYDDGVASRRGSPERRGRECRTYAQKEHLLCLLAQ